MRSLMNDRRMFIAFYSIAILAGLTPDKLSAVILSAIGRYQQPAAAK